MDLVSQRGASQADRARAGFTLAELLVVIGILALLLALLLPAIARARASVRQTVCAAQLREMGRAMQLYAADNGNYVPRSYKRQHPDRRPFWVALIGPYLEERTDWDVAANSWQSTAAGWEAHAIIAQVKAVHCPEQPWAHHGPGTYMLNSFMFESQPNWQPAPHTRLSRVRSGAGVIWIGEVHEIFGFHAQHNLMFGNHDIFTPMQLPGGGLVGISDDLHNGATNLLYFDGSVRRLEQDSFSLPMFDDGIRGRRVKRIW